jgi:hypothetical protein
LFAVILETGPRQTSILLTVKRRHMTKGKFAGASFSTPRKIYFADGKKQVGQELWLLALGKEQFKSHLKL